MKKFNSKNQFQIFSANENCHSFAEIKGKYSAFSFAFLELNLFF